MVIIGIDDYFVNYNQDPHFGLEETASSDVCLECHNDLRMTHPVDVNYTEARINRSTAVLKPIETLPSAIVLVDNRVVCISCHDMQSTSPSKLVLNMKGSALCMICHDR